MSYRERDRRIYEPQCDQYTGSSVRSGPPISAQTSTPNALPTTSSSAFSMAAMPCWARPPTMWR
eukprot:6765804-Prymnesium_polylepis.1